MRRKQEANNYKKSEQEAIRILDEQGINQDTQNRYFDNLFEKIDNNEAYKKLNMVNPPQTSRDLSPLKKSYTSIGSPSLRNRHLSSLRLPNFSLQSSDISQLTPKRNQSDLSSSQTYQRSSTTSVRKSNY